MLMLQRSFSSLPRRPLEGYRVIECGHLVAGPFASTILAYFGAEVIKIEPPTGDQIRDYRILDETNTSLWWYSIGRNKKSLCLDLKTEKGRKLVASLCEKSDVLIENFRPGKMEEWGLGPSDLNPNLIYSRISGYGQDGPYSNRPGFASVCEAMGGFRYVNGFKDRPAVRPNLSLGDTLAGLHAVLGITMALLARNNSKSKQGLGHGQVVDVAIYEAVFNMLEAVVPEYDYNKTIRQPSGSTLTGIVPSNIYPCSDGKSVVIGANTDSLFVKLMNIIGRADMAGDTKFKLNIDRVKHQEAIDTTISQWTSTRDSDTVFRTMEAGRIPVGLIYSVEDMFQDPQYKQRNMLEQVVLPSGKQLTIPAMCPKLHGTPGRTEWSGCPLGFHTEEVLRDVLQLSPKEIQSYVDEKVVFKAK